MIDILLLGIMCGFFGLFVDFITTPGQIFGFYYTYIVESCIDSNNKYINYIIKPLGGCVYCTNVWLTFLICLLTKDLWCYNYTIQCIVGLLFLIQGTQYITIKIYLKWKKKKKQIIKMQK